MNYWGISIASAVLVLICIYWHLVADARCDNIMFKRTSLSIHPYRDYWHLQKTIRRVCLFAAGLFFGIEIITAWKTNLPQILLILILLQIIAVVLFLKKWEQIAFEKSDRYLDKDEALHLSTSIHWLDNFLGLHH